MHIIGKMADIAYAFENPGFQRQCYSPVFVIQSYANQTITEAISEINQHYTNVEYLQEQKNNVMGCYQ